MRGYFGIGVEHSKFQVNIGTLWRSAYALGAEFIFTIGSRYSRQSTDTSEAWKHIPLVAYADIEDFSRHIPYDCLVIGVEITPQATCLETFLHPERAIYLLGPEDGSLSKEAQSLCCSIVKFESKFCLNVASAGTIVMYDRQTKRV